MKRLKAQLKKRKEFLAAVSVEADEDNINIKIAKEEFRKGLIEIDTEVIKLFEERLQDLGYPIEKEAQSEETK